MSIDAMKQALEYTRPGAIVPVTPETVKILVDALRLAIEQAERQEPLQAEYERGFIDGMQKQMQSSVDKAVNRMATPQQVEKLEAQLGEAVWNYGEAKRLNAQLLEALGNMEEYSKRMGNVASNLAANQMPKHLNASYEGDDLYTGDQLRAAVAAEREACAKVIDDLSLAHPGRADLTALQCAAAIRARGDKQ